MKNREKRLLLLMLMVAVLSCNKPANVAAPAAVNIINAIPTSQGVIPVFGTTDAPHYFANAREIGYGGVALYSPVGGSIALYIVQSSDTGDANPKNDVFYGNLNLVAGGIYSLFLAGENTNSDTVFVQDHLLAFSDSSAAVRFVNLSTGSQPITVNIQGNQPNDTEFGNLSYKAVSEFKKYSAKSSVPGYYNFEIRDQKTDTLLVTFQWGYTLYRNNTLIISGSEAPGSSTPLQIIQMNNF
ncbi:MAG: hypothetical protein P4L51_06265 [Puia sp.]|nr:hypothetical protein [Puia sp.]